MAMDRIGALNDIDPAVRAAAEVRAREAGMSLNDWIGYLVCKNALSICTNALPIYGGGSSLVPIPLGQQGSFAFSALASPIAAYDVDIAARTPRPRSETEGWHVHHIVFDEHGSEAARSAFRLVAAFPTRISHAAILLSAAFAEAEVEFRLPPRRSNMRHKATHDWYHSLIDTSLHRAREVRDALAHHWTPSGRAEWLWNDAFVTLCDLTPARHELVVLYNQDRARASAELIKYLDLATQEFELSATLLADVENAASAETANEQRFSQLRASLLERADGGVSLTEGAKLLGISRQALHKRIKMGSALGMKDKEEIVLPRAQWTIQNNGKAEFVPGLADVIRLFDRAGGWSALQFLLDRDPNLGEPPIEALRMGKVEAAVSAARAYLGLDEG